MEAERFVRLPEVERLTGLKRAHLYQLARKGDFPRPLKIGARASAWRSSQVEAWVQARISANDRAARVVSSGGCESNAEANVGEREQCLPDAFALRQLKRQFEN